MAPVLRSRLDTSSEDYRQNVDAMERLWAQVAEKLSQLPTVGGQEKVDRHRRRNKMLVRRPAIDAIMPTLEQSTV